MIEFILEKTQEEEERRRGTAEASASVGFHQERVAFDMLVSAQARFRPRRPAAIPRSILEGQILTAAVSSLSLSLSLSLFALFSYFIHQFLFLFPLSSPSSFTLANFILAPSCYIGSQPTTDSQPALYKTATPPSFSPPCLFHPAGSE